MRATVNDKTLSSLLLAGLALVMTGCTHTLVVEGRFPSPLVSVIPATVGLHLPEEFKSYRYIEDSNDRTKWIIDMGEAQTRMFQTVLPGMFNQVRELNGLPTNEEATNEEASNEQDGDAMVGLDVVITPRIEEFQYTLPSETKIKVYEIWLKYNVQVFDNRGTLIADWILTAYGKTPTGFMQSDEAALNQAVVIALRDAGANLALNFANVPEVRAWLSQL